VKEDHQQHTLVPLPMTTVADTTVNGTVADSARIVVIEDLDMQQQMMEMNPNLPRVLKIKWMGRQSY